MAWQKTGVAIETLAEGSSREVLLGSTSVLLVRTVSGVHAVEAVCPHQGGLFADGFLDGERLSCPEHTAAFDVRDGHVLADPFGIDPPQGGVGPLTTYPTRVESGMVEVELPG